MKGSGLMVWQQKCHLGSWVPSSQGCWRSVTMATPNELNLVTDPYLFLICGPLGTLAGNQLENNLVTYQKENYLYLFIQVKLLSPFDDSARLKTPVAFLQRFAWLCRNARLRAARNHAKPPSATAKHTHKLPRISVLVALLIYCQNPAFLTAPDLPVRINTHPHPFLDSLIFYVGIRYSHSFVLYPSAEIWFCFEMYLYDLEWHNTDVFYEPEIV